MINIRDVIRMRIPYPNISAELAADGYDTIKMDEDELTKINPMITKI